MADNKTKPTDESIDAYISGLSEKRQKETRALVYLIEQISGLKPVIWGPSIIGFGTRHYKYESGREGDMPILGFSPRKAAISIYFYEGFHEYSDLLNQLGKYKNSGSCLYINKLEDVNIKILRTLLEKSFKHTSSPIKNIGSVADYIANVPLAAKSHFDELRNIARAELPDAREVVSYGIIGYKIDDKRPRVFVSGWKDHTAIYPVPKDESLKTELKPYIKGKGTLWFPLDKPLPKELIKKTIKSLAK